MTDRVVLKICVRLLSAPEVLSSLSDAQNQVTNTSVLLGSLETHLSQMERVVLELLHKTSIIRNTSKEGITLMNESFVNGEQYLIAESVYITFHSALEIRLAFSHRQRRCMRC